ncbi:MAG: TIGR01906 family membrane protein [Erysipelotrichaceae bacterium]
MKLNKYFSYFMIFTIIISLITSVLAFIILFRPFYYLNIHLLDLVETTGYSYAQIKTAYDEMMNYCLGLTNQFSCGDLKYSIEGMNHFTDCRNLFMLDFFLMAISLAIIAITFYLKKKGKIELTYFNHNFTYYSSMIILILFSLISLLAIGDFNSMFVKFHHLFFPNKDNWLFDPRYDQIINILPEQFFINCVIAIVAMLFIFCIFFIYKEYHNHYRKERQFN